MTYSTSHQQKEDTWNTKRLDESYAVAFTMNQILVIGNGIKPDMNVLRFFHIAKFCAAVMHTKYS